MRIATIEPKAQAAPPPPPVAEPAEGFQKTLAKVQADQGPPGAPPPTKASNKQAGEVANKEQKAPSQKPDSPPETEQSSLPSQPAQPSPAPPAAQGLVQVIAQELAVVAAPGASLPTAAPSTAPVPANVGCIGSAQAPANNAAIKLAPDSATAAKEGVVKASASDEPDSDEETAVSGPKHLVGDAAHPELGKVSVTVTKLAEEADEGGTGDTASGGKEGKSSSKDPVLNLTETQAPQDAAVAKTSDVQPAAQAATPISNEQRDVAFRQVSDRLELLAASRPREAVTINLHPVDLGSVTVVLKIDGGKMAAELFASHDGVRDALKQDADQLATGLQSRGVAMTQVTVNASAEPQQSGSNTHYPPQSGQNQATTDFGQRQNTSGNGQRQTSPSFTPGNVTALSTETTHAGGGSSAVDLWI